jgi:gamma-butyrobetaine dioxygenase
MTEATIDAAAAALRVTWPDGEQGLFPFLWLRDNCPSGFHPETEERFFDLLSVSEAGEPETVSADADAIRIVWREDGHVSAFDPGWLRARRPGRRFDDAADQPPLVWDAAALRAESLPRAEADALLSDDRALVDWLSAVRRTGLGMVVGLADDPEAGMAIARRVGFLRETNFGVTFEVRSKPNPNTLAYTAHALPMHTDLPNQELAPGFQFLHCVENTATGGGSIFADGYALAEALRAEDPEAFALLRDTAIPFRFHDGESDLRKRDTVIRCDHDGRVDEIRWSTHLTDTFDLPPEDLPAYYRAYRRFMALTRDPRFHVTLRLASGEMAVFDNRRTLHGRESFDPASGKRFLRGFYVDRGEWDSRIRVLSRG